ncbi:unnamed protein product [Symbiodinium pilosum]|uniref:Uncharacterized protein n=1 Tax=Symbiodinium pilosum TaxID=2952 RepID=A0A812INZ3_SYMPI|nr:unnamed protein product [Symbiodinium pilosum]
MTLHFFSMGFVVGGLDAILFNVLEGYLNEPSDIMKGAQNVATLPIMFSVFLGILSDSRPVFGYRRRPYMVGGWMLAATSFIILLSRGLPAPYYCFSAVDGHYLMDEAPCNPEAVDFYSPIVICLCFAMLGCTAATSAAEGLLVEYAKAEPEEYRGSAQTTLHMVRVVGNFTAVATAAFGFNGRLFTGSFDQQYQLSYPEFIGLFAAISIVTAVSCLFCVREGAGSVASIRAYCSASWNLLESKAFCAVALYIYYNSSISSMFTSAGVWVGLEWAHTEDLQRQIANMLGTLFALLGCWFMQRFMLNVSWRKIIFGTIIFTVVLDVFPQFLTIFDVVRNQYFYLGEPVTKNVPKAMTTLVYAFLVNELADESNTALVVGLLQTIQAVGEPLSNLLSSQLFSLFTPDLYLRLNYIKDTPAFRWTVAWSFLLSYLIMLLGLLTLPLFPSQKEEPSSIHLAKCITCFFPRIKIKLNRPRLRKLHHSKP